VTAWPEPSLGQTPSLDPRFEGRGVAAALVRHSLDDTRCRGLTVIPPCPFYQGGSSVTPNTFDVLYQHPSAGYATRSENAKEPTHGQNL
jgi:hypothetical protein